MGWTDNIADRIRARFTVDKEKKALDAGRGRIPAGARIGMGTADSAYGYEQLSSHLNLEHDLMGRYIDYEEMDDFPEISAAVDVYADDSTQIDLMRRKTVWVVSENERVRQILDDLLHKQLRIEEDVWGATRTLVKYGNLYGEILVNQEGVIGLNFLPPPTMRRIEDESGGLLGFVQDPAGRGLTLREFRTLLNDKGQIVTKPVEAKPESKPFGAGAVGSETMASSDVSKVVPFEDWEVVHWRLRGKHLRSIYGFSVLEAARWVWRRLTLLEDAVLLHKLTRSPARYAYYIDCGDLSPQQAMAYVNEIKNNYKKKKYITSDGKIDFKVNPLGAQEDFWLPSKGGKESTRIDLLSGADWQALDDVNYFRSKLFTALKMSSSFVGLQEGGDTRSNLANQDVRFARTVLRLQREFRNGLKKVCRVHLAALGIDPHAVEWDVQMASPSSIFELAQIEARTAQTQLAEQMSTFVPRQWLLKTVFGFTEDEIADMQGKKDEEDDAEAVKLAEREKKQAEILGITPEQQLGGGEPPAEPEPRPSPEESTKYPSNDVGEIDDMLSSLEPKPQVDDLYGMLDALLEANPELLTEEERNPTPKKVSFKKVAG